MHKIGVDKELGPVGEYLREHGYSVSEIDTVNPDLSGDFDAVVISGLERDMFGMHNTTTRTPIIDATGMTPEEVLDKVKSKIDRIH